MMAGLKARQRLRMSKAMRVTDGHGESIALAARQTAAIPSVTPVVTLIIASSAKTGDKATQYIINPWHF